MANVIREQKLVDNNKRALIKYVILADGTATANVRLLDASMLNFALNTNGKIMTSNVDPRSNYRSTVKRIFGSAKTSGAVKLQWQGDANSEILAYGSGTFDYDFQSMGDGAVILNPEANATGDILISLISPSNGDVHTIFLDIRKDARDYDQGQTADPVAFNRGPGAP